MARGKRPGLFRRPASRYWWIRYVDASGVHQRLSSKTKNRDEAEAMLDRLRAEAAGFITGQTIVPGRAITLGRLAEEYLDAMKARRQNAPGPLRRPR